MGLIGTFVPRREPEYDYARAEHDVVRPTLVIPYSPLNDPPRDSDFATANGHPPAAYPFNIYYDTGYSEVGMLGPDAFLPIQAMAHPLTQQRGAGSPRGAQTPWNERFNNSGLANNTTSYNTVVDKLVAALKLRRGR